MGDQSRDIPRTASKAKTDGRSSPDNKRSTIERLFAGCWISLIAVAILGPLVFAFIGLFTGYLFLPDGAVPSRCTGYGQEGFR